MTQLIPAIDDRDHINNPDAILEVVEYGDYQCPHCGYAYPIIKSIQQQLGPDLKFVFRNFPLSNIHPHAFPAAVATEAAGLQHKFWEMHDIIFEHQQTLDEDSIFEFAQAIGLDLERFKHDIRQTELFDKVEKDIESGIRSGVNGTPTFFVNGKIYEGDWAETAFLEFLNGQLEQISIY